MSDRTEQELPFLAMLSKLKKEIVSLKSGQSLHAKCHEEIDELRENIDSAVRAVQRLEDRNLVLNRAYRAAAKVAQEAHRKVHGAPCACFPLDQPERAVAVKDLSKKADLPLGKSRFGGMVDE